MNHQFTFDMPDKTYALVCEAADGDGMTVEEYILDTIREHIARKQLAQDLPEGREEHPSS
ncbi:hypothetical protein [Rhizobium sp. FY34]|uniref:hypothetical protein n=1 Tax=Rhizobium sp. FY34 TaxID=2562309 RepID=UPI0010BFCE5F|nr:hypothetical protein [Rhizobium sp. FY34]